MVSDTCTGEWSFISRRANNYGVLKEAQRYQMRMLRASAVLLAWKHQKPSSLRATLSYGMRRTAFRDFLQSTSHVDLMTTSLDSSTKARNPNPWPPSDCYIAHCRHYQEATGAWGSWVFLYFSGELIPRMKTNDTSDDGVLRLHSPRYLRSWRFAIAEKRYSVLVYIFRLSCSRILYLNCEFSFLSGTPITHSWADACTKFVLIFF